jgi:hypothetical protein
LLAAIDQLATLSSYLTVGFLLPAINQLTTLSSFTASSFCWLQSKRIGGSDPENIKPLTLLNLKPGILLAINHLTDNSSYDIIPAFTLIESNKLGIRVPVLKYFLRIRIPEI